MALTLYSNAASPLGRRVLRDDSKVSLPANRRPTLVHVSLQNKRGDNVNVSIVSTVPVVKTTEQGLEDQGKFICRLAFTSRQDIVSDAERTAALDNLIKYINDNKTSILAGKTPTN